MEFVAQRLEDIVASLRSLQVDWRDAVAQRAIATIEAIPVKVEYREADVRALLAPDFDDGMLIARLFLGLSRDQFQGALQDALGPGGSGVQRYRADPDVFVRALLNLGLVEANHTETHRVARWGDVLIERLRSGRGSAISGQRRGREVEDFAEAVIRRVFGDVYDKRCTFTGAYDKTAKCDFAVPNRSAPRLVVEAKGYGATGSKMTDVIGDIEKIIAAKRHDMAFLFFTDGVTWRRRKSDLSKIVKYQNNGGIGRIYTYAMAERFEADLRQLKDEYKL